MKITWNWLCVIAAAMLLNGPAWAQGKTVELAIEANGQTGGARSAYVFNGTISDADGSFEGTYEFDLSNLTEGVWRAAAKRGWDIKLRWGTPANPPPIVVLGEFDLTVDGATTMDGHAERFRSDAQVSGDPGVMKIGLRYEEPPPERTGSREQVSYTTFTGDGPGRISFQTSHHDGGKEFASTRGLIVLRGAPDAVLEKPVHTRFIMTFEPGPDLSKGRFKGRTEVTEKRLD